jgi:hypothetical protein
MLKCDKVAINKIMIRHLIHKWLERRREEGRCHGFSFYLSISECVCVSLSLSLSLSLDFASGLCLSQNNNLFPGAITWLPKLDFHHLPFLRSKPVLNDYMLFGERN